MGMERRGRTGRAVHVGSKRARRRAQPSYGRRLGLAGLYVTARASHDGACVRAPPQPTSCGVARQNSGCGGCGESGVRWTHDNPRPGMPWIPWKCRKVTNRTEARFLCETRVRNGKECTWALWRVREAERSADRAGLRGAAGAGVQATHSAELRTGV
eukprot:93126-Prymnesium_polylepis.1